MPTPYPHVKVGVNLDPRLLAGGTRQQILAEVDDVLRLAQGRPDLLLGTGAVPYETPPESILLISGYLA